MACGPCLATSLLNLGRRDDDLNEKSVSTSGEPLLARVLTCIIAAALGWASAQRARAGEPVILDFYPRGDADCSVGLTAADVVAHSLGRGGSVCENDDCDRDGTPTEADVVCGANCLFGDCPLLPGSPQASEIAPETAEDVVALSLIRIRGTELSSLLSKLRFAAVAPANLRKPGQFGP